MFSGRLPAEITRMRSLNFLNLQNNCLAGNLPDEIGDWESLVELYLANNEITGTLPASIGKMKRLKILDVFGEQNEWGCYRRNWEIWKV